MTGLPDDPAIVDLPMKFADTVLAEGFDRDELDEHVPQLMSFAATFYLRFLKDEYATAFTGFDDVQDREAVLRLLTEAEVDGADDVGSPLLETFDDVCDLYDEIGDDYGSHGTTMYDDEIVAQTENLLLDIAGWAEATERPRLFARATEAADRVGRVRKWMKK